MFVIHIPFKQKTRIYNLFTSHSNLIQIYIPFKIFWKLLLKSIQNYWMISFIFIFHWKSSTEVAGSHAPI